MKKSVILLLTSILLLLLTACHADTASPSTPSITDETTHLHHFTQTVTAPNCTTAGYTTYTCDCGESYFKNLTDAIGHSYTNTTVPPTSDAEGYTQHTCTTCGDVFTDSFVDPIDLSHKHRYAISEKIAPGCTTVGYTVYSCDCGDSYMDNLSDATGHSYADQIIPPTADAQGYTEHSCTACGDIYTDTFTEALPVPHQHQYVEAEIFAPDCIAEGCTLYRCDCGDEFYGNYTAIVDHKYSSYVVAPTHTSEGFTSYTCSGCGDSYQSNFVARTPGHTHLPVEVIAPTCKTEGYTFYECACGDCYLDDYVSTTEHSYTVAAVIQPNCATEGHTIYLCECGDEYSEVFASSLPHTYVAVKVVEPTYDTEGYTVYFCTGCGDTYQSDYTEKLQPEEDEPSSEHSCSGDCHEEIQQGGYTYVYCDTIEAPYLSEDGFTVYYPYEYYF